MEGKSSSVTTLMSRKCSWEKYFPNKEKSPKKRLNFSIGIEILKNIISLVIVIVEKSSKNAAIGASYNKNNSLNNKWKKMNLMIDFIGFFNVYLL